MLCQLVESVAGLMPAGERAKTPGCRNTQIERFQGANTLLATPRMTETVLYAAGQEPESAQIFFVRADQTNPTSPQSSALKATPSQ